MRLSYKRRLGLKKSVFGLKRGGKGGKGKYPMPDRRHAANAKARASQMLARGKLSHSAYSRIVAKANRILSRKK